MSTNRTDLIKQMNGVTTELLREKGYICFVDVLLKMGKLTLQDYEAWRKGKVPCLERVITINLAKISVLLRALHANCLKGGLRPSWTAYASQGKGMKQALRFSISGDPNVERAYATHYLLPTKGVPKNPPSPPFRKGGDLTATSEGTEGACP